MARVIFEGAPSVAPAEPPGVFEHVPAALPEAFGGLIGAAQQRFGAQTEQGANELFAAYQQRQELYNQAATDDAWQQFDKGTQDILYGDPSDPSKPGYYSLQGDAAMRARPQVMQQVDSLRNQILGTLQNDRQRVEFNTASRRLQMFTNADIGRHYEQQLDVYSKQTNMSGLANDVHAVSLDYTNDQAFNDRLAEIDQRAQAEAMREGASPERAQQLRDSFRAQAVEARVKGYVAHDDWAGAKSVLDQHGDVLGDQLAPLQKQINEHAKDAQMRAAVFGPDGGTPFAPAGKPTVSTMQVASAAQAVGVDPVLANTTAAIESGHGANVGTRGDIYQMGPNERASIGGGPAPAASADQQVQEGVRFLAQKRKELQLALGRDPTNAEVYLAHQQGTGGAIALLTHPDEPAGKVVGNDAAISNNGGDPNMPASAFVGMWQQRYNQAEQHYRGGEPAATVAADQVPGLSQKLQALSKQFPDPDDYAKAATMAETQYRAAWADQNRQYELHERAAKDASDSRENEIIADSMSGAPKITAQQIANDPALTPSARLRMISVVQSGKTGDSATAYGPGFWNAYKDITDHHLTDQAAIVSRAGPGGDLTLSGAQKLIQTLNEVKRPEAAGDQKMQAGALAYAKHQLSFEADYGTFKVRDPKGEDAFNIGFTPAFFKYWQEGIAAGKSPAELVAKDQIDKLVAPYKRPAAELMKDQLEAGTQATEQQAEAATGPPPAAVAYLKTNPALRTAFDEKYGAGSADKVLGPAGPEPPIVH